MAYAESQNTVYLTSTGYGGSAPQAQEGTRLRGVACAEGAGLVQYKTTPNPQQHISFSPACSAERRLKKLRRNVYLAGQLHSLPRKGHRPDQAWLITLTYDTKGTLGCGAHDWKPEHVTRAVDAFRRWCKRRGSTARYTWVAELQNKGTVHYHLVFWLPRGLAMPYWDKSDGSRRAFWRYGMSKTEKLKTNCSYLMKYLSKMGEFHRFPHGLRLCGNGGLDSSARSIRSWHNLPSWVKSEHGVGDVRRLKAGLVDMQTGEVLPPMYSRRFVSGGMVLTALRDVVDRWYDGPYSTWRAVDQ